MLSHIQSQSAVLQVILKFQILNTTSTWFNVKQEIAPFEIQSEILMILHKTLKHCKVVVKIKTLESDHNLEILF